MPRNICSKANFHAFSQKLVSNDLEAYDAYEPDKSISIVNRMKYCWNIVDVRIAITNNTIITLIVIFLFKKNKQKGMHIAYKRAALCTKAADKATITAALFFPLPKGCRQSK